MSEYMEQGILRMPPECWINGHSIDELQRHHAYVAAADRLLELRWENSTLKSTLDAVTAANERATAQWQAAHPGKELVIPDQAKMVEWLLEELAKFDDPHRLHAHCVRYLTDAQVAHLFGERMTEIVNSRDKLESQNAALRKE